MYLTGYLYLFAINIALAAAEGVQRRGFPSLRGGRTEPDVDIPSTPGSSSSGIHGWSNTGSSISHLGDDTVGEVTPQYQPASRPNECLQHECLELTVEVARQVVEQILDNLGGGPSSTAIVRPMSTQFQRPWVTAQPTATPMPNLDVAKTMALDQESLALFDDEEQDMYFHDRMCFYANVGNVYANVASTSSKTRLAARDGVNAIDQINSRMTAAPTPLASASVGYYQRQLWKSEMPDMLQSIYAPVSANNASMTTATTTCAGLGSSPSITMSYVQARVSTPSPTPDPDSEMHEGAANVQAKAGASAIFGAVVALFGLIAL